MFISNVKGKKRKKAAEDSDSDDSDLDDLDDEEVSLGSMDEEDFGDELEEEGGTFMDPDGGGDEFDDDDEHDDEGRKCQCGDVVVVPLCLRFMCSWLFCSLTLIVAQISHFVCLCLLVPELEDDDAAAGFDGEFDQFILCITRQCHLFCFITVRSYTGL